MTTTAPRRSLPPMFDEVTRRWTRLTAPRPSGLPNLLVLLWFPVLLVLLGVVLVALGISGSSTGAYWTEFGTGHDAHLLAGQPREIRTDEWLVQSSWIVSQVEQGFPVLNHTLPGGMDATIQNDLPSWDWSSAFRPHVLGFLFLPLDQGMAVRWWLPVIALVIAIHAFVVTLLPRRPVLAAAAGLAVALSPLVQWWFLPTTIWPVAWAFAALTAIIWCLRSGTTWARWVMSAVAGYLTVTMVMSIYVPFMVPAAVAVVVVGAAFLVAHGRGLVLDGGVRAGAATLRTVRAVLPLIVAVVGAVVVVGVWIVTRAATIQAVLGTVYPGQRLQATGPVSFDLSIALLAGPFMRASQDGSAAGLAVNQSEAAVPILTAVFLVPGLVWCLVLAARRRRVDWPALGVLVTLALVTAFLQVPHWDRLAHLLLLDRTTDARMRLVFDVLAPIALAVVVRRLDAERTRAPWSVALWGPALVVGSVALVYVMLRTGHSDVIDVSRAWKPVTVLLAVGVLLVLRRWATSGAVLLLAAAVVVGLQVNPVYRGVYDLNDTSAGKDIAAIEAKHPDAHWVGIGTRYATPLLVESGVTAYNGVQTYPPRRMWHEIDPKGVYENEWNRLANVGWVVGPGAPVVSNPYRDQIQVTFDACSRFAQRNVDYVLSESPVDSSCLTEVDDARQGASDITIYRVR
ncbi:DUF7657 domain-containing protein [Curtobacterium sp. RRHDQ10]|uniref:DUF7657 domain-containing protein n=1 Tax=Curtobacterium phyllosphaerae TaxID=3413379 RepID=UPI003BF1F6D1